jgi:hypothetical protein
VLPHDLRAPSHRVSTAAFTSSKFLLLVIRGTTVVTAAIRLVIAIAT